MVKYESPELDKIFHALADPTRRRILARLAESDTTVGELAGPMAISWPAVTKHLRVLERARLVVREKEGRVRRCHLETRPLQMASEWVSYYQNFWEERLERLSALFEDIKEKEAPSDERTSEGNG